jgi:[histone H3]-lysine79 N-trimethyltransferase
MLSSPTSRPSSSDFDFFSPSKSPNSIASSSNNVIVKTRIAHKPLPLKPTAYFSRSPLSSSSPSPDSSPLSSPPSPKKRKSLSPESISPLHREVKRLRPSGTSADRPRKRVSKSSCKTPSRASSRQQTSQPSPEPIYRTSRSRSTSAFHAYDDDVPNMSRRWMTDEDGVVTPPSHLSSEAVVQKLLKSYKQCQSFPLVLFYSYTILDFKNPDNPQDSSFSSDIHLPRVELEYPNTHSSEKCVKPSLVTSTSTWGLTPDTF